MEARSGNLINGSDRVEAAARAGKVHLLIHAPMPARTGKEARPGLAVGGGGPGG
jgi:uncharacterized protein